MIHSFCVDYILNIKVFINGNQEKRDVKIKNPLIVQDVIQCIQQIKERNDVYENCQVQRSTVMLRSASGISVII